MPDSSISFNSLMQLKSPSNRPVSLQPLPLAAYLAGAVGSSFLINAPQAEAAVVYWNPTDFINSSGYTTFDMVTGEVNSSAPVSDSTFFTITNAGTDYVYIQGNKGGPAVGGNNISKLGFGFSINNSSTFNDGTWNYFDQQNRPENPWNTEEDGTTGYIGLRFVKLVNFVEQIHYGWARITYDDATTGNLTLHDFAYETVAGQGITVGDIGAVPEPSRALLALAGLGAATLRRRRKQAA
jgi:hypothetical protein